MTKNQKRLLYLFVIVTAVVMIAVDIWAGIVVRRSGQYGYDYPQDYYLQYVLYKIALIALTVVIVGALCSLLSRLRDHKGLVLGILAGMYAVPLLIGICNLISDYSLRAWLTLETPYITLFIPGLMILSLGLPLYLVSDCKGYMTVKRFLAVSILTVLPIVLAVHMESFMAGICLYVTVIAIFKRTVADEKIKRSWMIAYDVIVLAVLAAGIVIKAIHGVELMNMSAGLPADFLLADHCWLLILLIFISVILGIKIIRLGKSEDMGYYTSCLGSYFLARSLTAVPALFLPDVFGACLPFTGNAWVAGVDIALAFSMLRIIQNNTITMGENED